VLAAVIGQVGDVVVWAVIGALVLAAIVTDRDNIDPR
jgi:hypothetical protein